MCVSCYKQCVCELFIRVSVAHKESVKICVFVLLNVQKPVLISAVFLGFKESCRKKIIQRRKFFFVLNNNMFFIVI